MVETSSKQETTIDSAQSAEALAAQAAKGDEKAFTLLAQRFAPALNAIISARNLPEEEREDLSQEGLLGLYKAVLLFDPSLSSFATFARICMRSAITDGARKLARSEEPLFLSDSSEEAISLKEDPQRILIGKEDLEQALRGVDQVLSPKERQIFMLHLRGIKTSEIALRLGISRKSTENALFRSRAKLSQLSLR